MNTSLISASLLAFAAGAVIGYLLAIAVFILPGNKHSIIQKSKP